MTKPIFIDYPRDDAFNTINWAKCLVSLIYLSTGIGWGVQKNTTLRELCFYTLDEELNDRPRIITR